MQFTLPDFSTREWREGWGGGGALAEVIPAAPQVSLKVVEFSCVQYKYKGKPFKIFLTVYPTSHALCTYAAMALAHNFNPASDWLLSPRFPSELQDADIALHCSKMAAVIQNPLKA